MCLNDAATATAVDKGSCAVQKRDKTGYHYVAQKVAYLAGFGTVVTRNNLNL
jgi:hypothetical protein